MMRRVWQACALFGFFFTFNFLFRYPEIKDFWYLNEDASLLQAAPQVIADKGYWSLFAYTYGPRIIRPLQLLGMYFEHSRLGLTLFQSQLVSIALLALTQLVIFFSLARVAGAFGSFVAVLPLGLSILMSEPNLWLSDRHDLYLGLFAAISFAAVMRIFLMPPAGLWPWVALLFGWTGGFMSNEKGAALPTLTLLAALLISLLAAQDRRKSLVQRVGVLAGLTVVSTSGYLLLRYLVIGQAIGGYDDALLPKGGLSALQFLGWILNLFSLPMKQAGTEEYMLAVCAIAPILIALGVWTVRVLRERKIGERRISFIGCVVVAMLVAAGLPTLKFATNPSAHIGSLMGRMHYLPLLAGSVLIGAMFGFLYSVSVKSSFMRAVLIVAALQYLGVLAYGGKSGISSYQTASEFSRRAFSEFERSCACYDLGTPQAVGLPSDRYGVNLFTEAVWIEHLAALQGLPACDKPEERCEVAFGVSPSEIPYVTSWSSPAAKLTPYLPWAPKRWRPYSLKQFIEDFTVRFHPRLERDTLSIKGWAAERKSHKPVDALVLVVDGVPRLTGVPSLPREDVFESELTPIESRFGFLMEFDLQQLSPGEHELELFAVGLDEQGPRAAALASRRLVIAHATDKDKEVKVPPLFSQQIS